MYMSRIDVVFTRLAVTVPLLWIFRYLLIIPWLFVCQVFPVGFYLYAHSDILFVFLDFLEQTML